MEIAIQELNAAVQKSPEDVADFFRRYDKIDTLLTLGKGIYQFTITHRTYDNGIGLLQTILTAPVFESSSLTPLHLYYIELCLRARNYPAAYLVANVPIYSLTDPKLTGLTVTDVLRYFYLCGHVYLFTQNWTAATNAFRFVFYIPSNTAALSAFTVESYKKWLILSLLSTPVTAGIGSNSIPLTVPTVPRSVSPAFVKSMDKLCGPYLKLGKLFVSLDRLSLLQYVSDNANLFIQDHNMDIVQALIDSVARRRIVRLAQTYTSVALNEVRNEVGQDINDNDLRQLIQTMIHEHQLDGNMDLVTNMLVFNDESKESSTNGSIGLAGQLQSEMETLTETIHRLQRMNHTIQLDKPWLMHLLSTGQGTKEALSGMMMGSSSLSSSSSSSSSASSSSGTTSGNVYAMNDTEEQQIMLALAASLKTAQEDKG